MEEILSLHLLILLAALTIFILIVLLLCLKFKYELLVNILKSLTCKAEEICLVENINSRSPAGEHLDVYVDFNLQDKVKFLERTDFGQELSRDMLIRMAYKLVPVEYQKNTVVFNEKNYPTHLYFILEGLVRIYSIRGTEICSLNKYNFFGEIELALGLNYRQMSVITDDKPCLFLTVNESDFSELSWDTSFSRITIDTARQRYELLIITGFVNEN